MLIRQASRKDAARIADIGRRSFIQYFMNEGNAPELLLYVDKVYAPEALEKRMNTARIEFMVVEDEGEVQGFAELEWTCPEQFPSKKYLKLERLYLDPARVGTGAGAKLMKASIGRAKEEGSDGLWLQVLRTNTLAISFYERWGFKEFHRSPAKFKADKEQDLWLVLDLT
jgi:ribosomal protein S18 acetylase RimI-like enzyme